MCRLIKRRLHVHHEVSIDRCAVEISLEPISDDNWKQFPDSVVHSVNEDYYLPIESLAKNLGGDLA